MTIRVVRPGPQEPAIPPDSTRGDIRTFVAGYWVDYTGSAPTDAEVLALVAPTDAQKKAEKKLRLKKVVGDADDLSLLVRALLRVIVAAPNNLNQARQALLDAIDAENA